MPDSDTLLRTRRYKEALAQATKELAGKPGDKRGAMLYFGQALLFLGRYHEAQEHFEKLADEYRFMGSRVGYNFTYAGIANWFLGKPDRAVTFWEAGLKAGYQSQGGIEIPWVLLYAAARRPGSYSREQAEGLMRRACKRLDEEGTQLAISEFALKKKTFEQICADLLVLNQGRYADLRNLEDRSLVDFFAGVHALYDGNAERFHSQMLACAEITGYSDTSVELVIAECEIRHGPPKWKRQFSRWLRQNVTVSPKGKPGSGTKK